MRHLFLCLCLCLTFSSFSQEQIGLRIDNYAGIHGSLLNPAHNISSRIRWDINLLSFGFSAQTNYGFLENTNVFEAIRKADNFILRQDLENSPRPEDLVADFYNNNRLKYLAIFGNVMGPSFMIKFSAL